MTDALHQEIERNFDFFQRNISRYLPTNRGQFALLHDCAFVDFFDSPVQAELAGERQYSDGLYSIQEVTDTPVDLGFFSHAFDQGDAR